MGEKYFVYFRPDLTEFISQDFAEKYNVKLDNWLVPDGYYSEKEGVADRIIPDGSYVVLGRVSYSNSSSSHKIGQFVGLKCTGINWQFSHQFDYYPNSGGLDLDPVFAVVRVGKVREFPKVGLTIEKIKESLITERELAKFALQYNPNTVEARVYRLRLALQRELTK